MKGRGESRKSPAHWQRGWEKPCVGATFMAPENSGPKTPAPKVVIPLPLSVIPAKAGIHSHHTMDSRSVPGMTNCVVDPWSSRR